MEPKPKTAGVEQSKAAQSARQKEVLTAPAVHAPTNLTIPAADPSELQKEALRVKEGLGVVQKEKAGPPKKDEDSHTQASGTEEEEKDGTEEGPKKDGAEG